VFKDATDTHQTQMTRFYGQIAGMQRREETTSWYVRVGADTCLSGAQLNDSVSLPARQPTTQ